ncbi:hypothetical protein [Parafrankia sp. BMG5.11]|uniref:hypothetical protein n=1 Tax=Parafrankia sp. BMG5.11 TaxID=222540 RepID=UPI001404769A|nr:hypothetical protein [Parafrankia sp. BMG5.11]
MQSEILSIATIVGPILMLAVIIWAYMRNKSASRSTTQRAERGARELREEIEHDRDPI